MIRRFRFRQIQMEVESSINEVFQKAKTNQTNNDYYLFLCIAQYVQSYESTGDNPHFIDYRMDGYNDELRLNILIEYINHHYSFNSANTVDSGFSITLELMIYSHMWESKPVLKQLKRLVDLTESKRYNWNIKVPDMGKHTFIRNEIRDKLQTQNLKLAKVISQGFHSQLRNAFAHSDYSLEFETPKIELLNYNEPNWQIQSITFDEWTVRFCYTFMLSYYLHNKFQEERQLLNSGDYYVKLKDKDGNDQDGIITYRKEQNSFSGRLIPPT